jgi:kinesin family protein 2/24
MDTAIVAPYHTGSQLVLMDRREFVERCLKTRCATDDMAAVVHSKLWRMHVDSARPADGGTHDAKASTSAPPEGARGVPFKERLRPGMVVRYRRGADSEREEEFAMVICPSAVVAADDGRFRAAEGDGAGNRIDTAYILCSVVERAVLKNSFLVNVWQHVVVSVDEMEAEAVLQYDTATRYYFLDV